MTRPVADALGRLCTSRTSLLVMAFGKSPSDAYPLAVNVAQGAARYAEAEMGTQKVHLVAFARTPEDATRARVLLQYIAGWKTTQVFAEGRLVANPYSAAEVLECYLQASACTDPAAHCHTVIDDPCDPRARTLPTDPIGPSWTHQRVEVDRYRFPCSWLAPRFRFTPDHPARLEDQLQAAAVREGCAWCPAFDPAGLGKLGTRTASVPAFE